MTKNMRFSTGNKIPENDNLIKDIPLVGEIDFKEFGILKESIAGKPLCCAHCGGIVTNIKDVKIDEKMGKYFNCKFCGSVIILDDTTFAESQENFEWIIPQENKEEMQIKKGNSLVGVLDVSGSMYGPRLEGVKQSLITTLRDYKMNQKQAIFSLVTFESAVRIHSLDGEAIVTIAGDNIYSKKDIEELVKKEPWIKKELPKLYLEQTAEQWIQTVSKLKVLGSTALGPAIVAAKEISKAIGTGRILLLTDGMANIGLGSLQSSSIEGRSFYSSFAQELAEEGCIIDIVGIAGEGSLELKTLALLSEGTGGDLFYVTLDEIQDSFSYISGDVLVGRNAKMKFIVPEGIRLKNIAGIGTRALHPKSGDEYSIGGLTKSRKISFEFKSDKKIDRKTVPIQVQIHYKDENDNQRIRVVEEELEVEGNEEVLKDNIDANLVTNFTIQRAAQEMVRDKRASKEMIKQVSSTLRNYAPENTEVQSLLSEELDEMDSLIQEEEEGKAYSSDKTQASSFRMSKLRKK